MNEIEWFKKDYEAPMWNFIGNFLKHSGNRSYKFIDPVTHSELSENDFVPPSVLAIEQFSRSYDFLKSLDIKIEVTWLYGWHLKGSDIGEKSVFESRINNTDIYLIELFNAKTEDIDFLNNVAQGQVKTKEKTEWLRSFDAKEFIASQLSAIERSNTYVNTYDVRKEIVDALPEIYRLLFLQRAKHSSMFSRTITREEIEGYSAEERYAFNVTLYFKNLLNDLAGFYREKLWVIGFATALQKYIESDKNSNKKIKVLATAGGGHYGYGKIIDSLFATSSHEYWMQISGADKKVSLEKAKKKRDLTIRL